MDRKPDYSGLLEYCESDRQTEVIEALIAATTQRLAASDLGISVKVLKESLKRIRRNAARRGYAPDAGMPGNGPQGFATTGYSALKRTNPETGQAETLLWWEKSKAQHHALSEFLREFAAGLADDIPRAKPTALPKSTSCPSEWAHVIPMGDPHFGMYSWAKETGNDFNVDIAERDTLAAVRQLIEAAPPAGTIYIAPLGDVFHAETRDSKTTSNTHVLDTDSRYPRVIRIGAYALKECISIALTKFERVVVIIPPGNHAWHAEIWLSMFLEGVFADEPRVEVIQSHGRQYQFLRFGLNLWGFTHGNNRRAEKLTGLMPREAARMWGETRYRRWFTGHVHNDHVIELPDGTVAASYRTLAPADAWHCAEGYHAGRDMRRETYHARYGLRGADFAPIEMIHEALELQAA